MVLLFLAFFGTIYVLSRGVRNMTNAVVTLIIATTMENLVVKVTSKDSKHIAHDSWTKANIPQALSSHCYMIRFDGP